MKIALIGYGAMGKLIATLAKEKGHEILVVVDDIDAGLSSVQLADKLRGAEVAIDFTVAAAVRRNVEACLIAGIPLVEGTTGWNGERETIRDLVDSKNGALVYGSNFSIGVNLFFRITGFAAELVSKFDEYEAFVEERHHSRKKDAPSGTALKLKEIVAKQFGDEFSIAATRAGDIPGTHTVGFDSAPDTIELTHTARSREGFARGAILAAEWIAGRLGFYEFSDVMDEVLIMPPRPAGDLKTHE
ncbi:MAG: 4-hydroxy-tetrahydrodipicolinate reductase [Acidobacteria bacterium]|nr:4-hydroxy-tetrahydrodipicolinate reductase [Acidobacteriota bacterium]